MNAISFSTRALGGQLQCGKMALRPLLPCEVYMKELGTGEETGFSRPHHTPPRLPSSFFNYTITGPSSRAMEEESCVAQAQSDPSLSLQGHEEVNKHLARESCWSFSRD